MLSQRAANSVFAILVIVASCYFAWMAEQFETSGLLASSGLPSKFFPQLTLGFTALCAVVVIFLYARRGAAGGDEGQAVFADIGEARRGLLMLAVMVICYLIWLHAGFVSMAALAGPLSLAAMGIRSKLIYLTVLILTGVIYIVFTQLLGVQFS
ncbi:MAG: hypothetical protein GKR94_12635 [Gammaproteobacteria bacterium]|nr:hypothetical protein [Gammaproteobacteria bacterium]